MTRIHTDLSRVPVSVAPSPATSGTTLGVSDANAALLPDTYPYWAVLVPVNVAPTRSNSEIVKVTAGSSSGGTTTLTIVRAQGVPVTTAQTVTTSFDIYDANSAEALPQVSSSVTEVPSGTINGSNTTFTLSSTPTSGTVKLYQNGVRLKLTEDYTISGVTITMNTAPVTGDLLLADYSINSGTFSVGSNSFIDNETPSGTVDGSNTSFTLAFTPVTGTLHLFRDGQEIYATNDYTLSGTTITMVAAPVTGTVLKANYQKSVSVAGNADTVDGYHANATPTANQIPVLNGIGNLPMSTIPLPQGHLLNGKIVPSVASNNLTVALKGLDGNDPSASNPVYCRIGDTIRTVTSALSVTKNAGTNWCNSGSAELATKEIDYFVYLGYNATDGVVIGFSRISHASIYSDFSATSTNEKYAAISTITNAAAGDYYELVGRFAATLSATSAFNWSVPTFTGANLIQRPIFDTRVLTYVPAITAQTGTPTNVTATGTYKISGGFCYLVLTITITDKGTGSGGIKSTLPFQTLSSKAIFGSEMNTTGYSIRGSFSDFAGYLNINKYDNTTMWANTNVCYMSDIYNI